mmetsp:Transcript_43231/g.100098  ORF Transcript_43231/g.100098 Transcript_43231/m.100098 type:complete len:701 (-) Transcript_43231:1315-3417(-)
MGNEALAVGREAAPHDDDLSPPLQDAARGEDVRGVDGVVVEEGEVELWRRCEEALIVETARHKLAIVSAVCREADKDAPHHGFVDGRYLADDPRVVHVARLDNLGPHLAPDVHVGAEPRAQHRHVCVSSGGARGGEEAGELDRLDVAILDRLVPARRHKVEAVDRDRHVHVALVPARLVLEHQLGGLPKDLGAGDAAGDLCVRDKDGCDQDVCLHTGHKVGLPRRVRRETARQAVCGGPRRASHVDKLLARHRDLPPPKGRAVVGGERPRHRERGEDVLELVGELVGVTVERHRQPHRREAVALDLWRGAQHVARRVQLPVDDPVGARAQPVGRAGLPEPAAQGRAHAGARGGRGAEAQLLHGALLKAHREGGRVPLPGGAPRVGVHEACAGDCDKGGPPPGEGGLRAGGRDGGDVRVDEEGVRENVGVRVLEACALPARVLLLADAVYDDPHARAREDCGGALAVGNDGGGALHERAVAVWEDVCLGPPAGNVPHVAGGEDVAEVEEAPYEVCVPLCGEEARAREEEVGARVPEAVGGEHKVDGRNIKEEEGGGGARGEGDAVEGDGDLGERRGAEGGGGAPHQRLEGVVRKGRWHSLDLARGRGESAHGAEGAHPRGPPPGLGRARGGGHEGYLGLRDGKLGVGPREEAIVEVYRQLGADGARARPTGGDVGLGGGGVVEEHRGGGARELLAVVEGYL